MASRIEPTHNETLVINRMMKHRYLWLTHHPVYGSPIIPVFQPTLHSVNLRDFVTPCPSLQMLKETLMLEPAQRIVNRKPEIERHIVRLGLG